MSKIGNQAAILIVNGGRDPVQGHWLSLCVGKIIENTPLDDYHLYVWNNNTNDRFVADYLSFMPNCTLVQAPGDTKLTHVHADPLQRLYERAKTDGARYVVTMDSDAHPLRRGWLRELTQALDSGAVLAGVWRDELRRAIDPYVHASGLCTSVDYLDRYQLRLDFIAPNREGEIHDTLSVLTETARDQHLPMHRLTRSNRRQFHRLMGGIYGDWIYHHGAGSRKRISFWDEQATPESMARNGRIGEIATHLLFTEHQPYMTWLLGGEIDARFAARMEALAAGHLEQFADVPTTPSG